MRLKLRSGCVLLLVALGLVSVRPEGVAEELTKMSDARQGAHAASQAGRPVAIAVADPLLRVQRSTQAVLPGWHGTIYVDRSDILQLGVGVSAWDLTSPDGQAHLQALPIPFHTYNVSPQFANFLPGAPATRSNATLGPFRSTAELLTEHIAPLLKLPGQPGPVERASEAYVRNGVEGLRRYNVPSPIWDAATVMYHQNGREALVRAVTSGWEAGTPREATTTLITIVFAPEGQAQAILSAQDALPPTTDNPAWTQADANFVQAVKFDMERQYAQMNANLNAQTQSLLAQGQANVRLMQQQGEQRRARFNQHEQMVTDLGALNSGYLGGYDVTYKWCGEGGARYTTNDTRSPGAGYRRCD